MSINIENNLKLDDNNSNLGKIHYLPCEVEGDGDANVEKYFTPYIKKVDEETLNVSFRGHPLSGSKFPLPKNYCLTLVTEAKTPLGGEAHRNLKVKGRASEDITYWNWDTRPSQNDALNKASKWITLAEALHEPLLLEDK